MLSLIKYDLKGNYKDIIIAVGTVIILNLLLFTRINVWHTQGVIGISMLINIVASITTFIFNIRLLSKDIYSDNAYLVFTLPKKGYSILTSKLITAIIQLAIISIVASMFNLLFLLKFSTPLQIVTFKQLLDFKLIAYVIILFIAFNIEFLTYVFFSISVSKIALKKNKIGKLGAFGLFIVLRLIIEKISSCLGDIMPKQININMVSSTNYFNNMGFPGIKLNLASLVFEVLVFIMIYVATSYILENKMDLN